MTIIEWQKKNGFEKTCNMCKHCRYDRELNIMYCKKMLDETDSGAITECEVKYGKSFCKRVIEE